MHSIGHRPSGAAAQKGTTVDSLDYRRVLTLASVIKISASVIEIIVHLADSISRGRQRRTRTCSSTAERLRQPAEPFIELLQAFKTGKEKCFGYDLKEGWRESIAASKLLSRHRVI